MTAVHPTNTQPPARPVPGPAAHHESAAPQLRFGDAFAGIGGFHLALTGIGAKCVWACENNPTARHYYETNFRRQSPGLFASGQFAGDITDIQGCELPDMDILAGGFPCQPFSNAGKRLGFADPRGVMFFHLARIIGQKRPRAFLLENVKGLLRHNDQATFRTILHVLSVVFGYTIHYKILQANQFGLPQLRPRVFLVGFRDPGVDFSFPEPIPLEFTLSDLFGGDCERAVGYTLLANGFAKPYGATQNFDTYMVDGAPRRLTVEQALQMQGFPPDFALPDAYTSAMRLIGNSVAVPVAQAVAGHIADALNKHRPAASHTPDTRGREN